MNRLRISVADLPERDADRTDEQLDGILRRLGAPEGAACELSCDCRIGLFCIDGACTAKE
jgi:hypothetical protein